MLWPCFSVCACLPQILISVFNKYANLSIVTPVFYPYWFSTYRRKKSGSAPRCLLINIIAVVHVISTVYVVSVLIIIIIIMRIVHKCYYPCSPRCVIIYASTHDFLIIRSPQKPPNELSPKKKKSKVLIIISRHSS